METEYLQSFISVATYMNFTKAADSLFISQPAISKQITELEKQLGVKLFKRDRHNCTLTKEGSALLPVALNIVEHTNSLISLAQNCTASTESSPFFPIGIDSRILDNITLKLSISHAIADVEKTFPHLQSNIYKLDPENVFESAKKNPNSSVITFCYNSDKIKDVQCKRLLIDSLSIVISDYKYKDLCSSGQADYKSILENMRYLFLSSQKMILMNMFHCVQKSMSHQKSELFQKKMYYLCIFVPVMVYVLFLLGFPCLSF